MKILLLKVKHLTVKSKLLHRIHILNNSFLAFVLGPLLLPELLVSQISVPRLLEDSASSGCSMLMLPCFLAKRGGILDAIVLFFTGI